MYRSTAVTLLLGGALTAPADALVLIQGGSGDGPGHP